MDQPIGAKQTPFESDILPVKQGHNIEKCKATRTEQLANLKDSCTPPTPDFTDHQLKALGELDEELGEDCPDMMLLG